MVRSSDCLLTVKSELEDKLRELKGRNAIAMRLTPCFRLRKKLKLKLQSKELLDIGVDDQDDYDRKVATLQNRVTHFKKLRALDAALSKGLITDDVYNQKKAALLGEDVTS